MRKFCLLIACLLTLIKGHAATFKAASVEFNPKPQAFEINLPALHAKALDAAKQGAKLIVLPEMATTGLLYKDRAQIEPFLDTIPGKTTHLLETISKQYNAYIVVGIAEKDTSSNLAYNAAALIGPKGYIGKYRKNGLNMADTKWATRGNLGTPVFETTIGKIAMVICYDDAYLEYLLLPALRGADIIAFISAPGQLLENEAGASYNHSTIANIASLSGWLGTYIVASSQTGVETNTSTNQTVYYVGGASIWDPNGYRLAQAKVSNIKNPIPAQTIMADISTKLYQNEAKTILETRRRPALYQIMNLARTYPPCAQEQSKHVEALLIQYTPIIGNKRENLKKIASLIHQQANPNTNLIVLPKYSLVGRINAQNIMNMAEDLQGDSIKKLARIAKNYHSYLAFSMPLKEGSQYYSAAILMNNTGQVIGVYRKTHLNKHELAWASAGHELSVFETSLGRIGMMLGDEVRIPDITNVLAMKRADIIIIPSAWYGQYGSSVEIQPGLLRQAYPPNTMSFWYNIAKYSQAYTLVANYVGSPIHFQGSSALYTLDPIEAHYLPITADATHETALKVTFNTLGKNDWWMNQNNLILGKRVELHPPLTLEYESPCFKAWRKNSKQNDFCWNH